MPKMTVISTALPNGLVGDDPANRRARLSVYLSMRLETDADAQGQHPDGKLGDFPQALAWPTTLLPVGFSVQAAGGAPVQAIVTSGPPDPGLWGALFTADTRVVSHAFDSDLTKNRPINTYPAASIRDQMRSGHQRLSNVSPVTLPTRQALGSAHPQLQAAFQPATPPVIRPAGGLELHLHLAENLFRPAVGSSLQQNVAAAFAVARERAETSAPGTFVPVIPNTGSPVSQFAQRYCFHYRPPIDPNNPPPKPPPVDPAKLLDFHQALTALAQYPELLRQLGLVFDLEVPESRLPQSPLDAPSGRLQIFLTVPQAASFATFSPATAYTLVGDRIFTSAPPDSSAPPEIVAGFLNLSQQGKFDLVETDIDSLGIKTHNMLAGDAIQSASSPDSGDDTASAGLPTPRGAGISLVREGHAQVLHQRLMSAAGNDARFKQAEPVTLGDADLIRGYRFDVFDAQAGRWHSLHARTGTYVFTKHPNGPLSLELTDEGFSQPSAVQQPDGSDDIKAQLYVHESLMRWAGWSLAAPRPGKTLTTGGPGAVSSRAVPGGFGLEVNFLATPGTLPRLRFGRQYRLRARAVDLAGNSLTIPDADQMLDFLENILHRPAPRLPLNGTDFTYRRFEPVTSPALVARERFTEGESLERLVIRSNGGESVDAYASRVMALVASKRPQERVIYTGANDRHVAPPKISQLMAETCGLPPLDLSFGTGTGFQQTYNIARKEKGRFTDAQIIDIVTGQGASIPDTTGIDPLTGAPITRPSVESVRPPQTVAVTVKTALGNSPAGASARYTYTDRPPPDDGTTTGPVTAPGAGPLIAKITPSHGSVAGGTKVVITGSGFTTPTEVWFGDALANQVSIDRETQITAVSPPAPEAFALHHEPQLRLPYLPDPHSRGATLCGLPGVPSQNLGITDAQGVLRFVESTLPAEHLALLGSLIQIDFGTAWPERLPFRLRLTEPPAPDVSPPPAWDPAARVLTVFLAKAEVATVRLSSFMNDDDLKLSGIWQWIFERNSGLGLPPPNAGDAQTATAGGMWMITPFREIELVHAVQQPLQRAGGTEPELQNVTTPRDPGATFAYFGATAKIHGKSTAKLDLIASWTERLDGPDLTRKASAHVFEVPIHLAGDAVVGGGQGGIVPIARYDPAHDPAHDADVVTFQAKLPGDQRTFLARHEFGDTKYRRVSYQLLATTRFREFFPPEVAELTRTGAAVPVDVQSTARPPAPKLVYAIPMFEWSRPPRAADGSQVETRKASGVRVYLERPWYASGDGELLAVVLANPSQYPPDQNLAPRVTQWGVDPIWGPSLPGGTPGDGTPLTGNVTGPPQSGNFPNRTTFPNGTREADAVLLENPGVVAQVACHLVEFDSGRDLWYCDISVDPGAVYFPFVRLALARYQPNSLPGLGLSTVVLADFVQLMPQRTVTVTPASGDPNSFSVTVEGLSYQGRSLPTPITPAASPGSGFEIEPSPEMAAPNLIQVSLEQRIAGTQDEAGWEPATGVAGARITAANAESAAGTGATRLWSGMVTLPQTRQPGQFRVVIREYQHLLTDERRHGEVTVHQTDPDLPPPPPRMPAVFSPGAPAGPTPRPGRMVFAETVEL
jgi:hypothetical protein